jgi:hypothetical protein
MLEILQTIGICVGSAALVVIAFFVFVLAMRFDSLFMPFDTLDEDDEEDETDDNPLIIFTNKPLDDEIDDEDLPPKQTGRRYGRRKRRRK